MAVFNSSLIGLGPSTPYRGRRRSRGTFGHAGGMEDWGQKRGNVMGLLCPTIRLSVRALLAAALFAFLAMAGLANPAAEQCALIQSVTAEDRANVGLTVIILKTADHKSRLLRVVAPMGVLLPSGLGLKIDNADIGRAGFVRCLPNGCIAEVIMDDELIKKLRSGKTATFIIFQTPEEGIGFPMSLAGFGEGYDKLP